jgi:hypothetical protein
VLVVGNPANTNAYIAMKSAPDLPAKNFTAMLRLDHNRAAVADRRQDRQVGGRHREAGVWGNHSPTMYADYRFCHRRTARRQGHDQRPAWNKTTFLPTVGKRGAAIIAARGLSSAASAANAAIDHMRDWALGTNGKWVTMGIPSDGSYGIPKDIMFGFPVTCENGEYKRVEGLVHRAFDIAAHPRVQSLSFGLMDFVSAHGGAIPDSAMGVQGQFTHPLVVRAKLEIAAACHAHGKVPSHCVVTEFSDAAALQAAAQRVALELGYTRMWSIHPAQIRPILEALSPSQMSVDKAAYIVAAAARAHWAPISIEGVLHDRASYRYYWQLLERAHATGRTLPPEVQTWFVSSRC